MLECPAAELPATTLEWIADDRALTIETEDRIAAQLGLAPGELLLDFPAKTQMLGLDLPVVRRSGEVRRLTTAGLEGAINLPVLSEQLYRRALAARVRGAPHRCADAARSRDATRRRHERADSSGSSSPACHRAASVVCAACTSARRPIPAFRPCASASLRAMPR